MDGTHVEFIVGIPELFRNEAALLYDEAFGWLRWLLGFGGSETLVKALPTEPDKSSQIKALPTTS